MWFAGSRELCSIHVGSGRTWRRNVFVRVEECGLSCDRRSLLRGRGGQMERNKQNNTRYCMFMCYDK